MAGNIQGLTLVQLNAKLEAYKQKVGEISTHIWNADDAIRHLHLAWTGKRVNAVIEKYNEIGTEFHQSWTFFSYTVKNVLEEIYSQYSSMENEGVAKDFTFGELDSMPSYAIDLTSTENIKFEQETVTVLVNRIVDGYENVATKIGEIVGILDELSASSDSLNKLVATYNAHAESIVSLAKNFKETITTEINEAVKTVQATEGYNENDARRIQQTEE